VKSVLLIGLGMPELLIVLAVLLLIFGGSRLPQLAKGLGSSIKEFKKGVSEGDAEESDSRHDSIGDGKRS
ncbi:MAG: twin-arginine translocase TatA/TatE family subunit, partial [Pyrinomonadaceae bacterium]